MYLYYLCSYKTNIKPFIINNMRIKHITNSLCFALSVLAFASCADNDVYNPDNAKNTGSLKVPADFGWTTTRTETCNITSPVNTRISIYSDKECKDDQLLAEVYVSKEKGTEVSFSLPSACKAYYVQYPTANGRKLIEVTPTTQTRAKDNDLILPEDASIVDYDETTDYYYTPAKNTLGTIMFEDLFPDKGDYDFNDFVAGYNLTVDLSRGNLGNTYDGLTITLQIRAIGGSKPYRLGIELTPLQTKYVRENYTITSDTEGIGMELITQNDEDPAVFVITGTNSLKDGSYYNTEKLSKKKMPTITCVIRRNNKNQPAPANQFGQIAVRSDHTNFFLQNTSTNEEIHLKGYKVTKYATNTNTTFNTDDNFVWGMKIPVLIPHAIEKTDFTEAYPKFAGWVTSGGNNNEDWYQTYKADKVINPGN